ncbi:MAG: hypothetical protein A3C11_02740 [Candidatus Sungbacteria bacterium RIFCSPHIGHO2_02_FULL_49_12]|uniref:Uncharacterized protein n=1 Tax=Candidatus Sungbacteria bacterium RIFCSPHIGHO2_02_FULL_49_12 TaxID=1802271 RepID=A0A1G2KM86_9BACT|nr:MAG: hypothetical protein A3C11_02740 [Candidatus Sungbacteria bacterium RIFCSPHIGHO2_02_FULL_49_12]
MPKHVMDALETLVTLNTARVAIADAASDEERARRRKEFSLQLANLLLDAVQKTNGAVWLRFRLLPGQPPIATSPYLDENFCQRQYCFLFIKGEEQTAYIDGLLYGHRQINDLGGWGFVIQDKEQYYFIAHGTGELVAVQIGGDFISIKGFNQPFASVNRGLFVAID